jgi:APA family basic amino acid/polyamine antiporter
MGLWTTKSIALLHEEAGQSGETGLRRSLTAFNLTSLGVGAVIGAGIFVLTGNAAAQYAGPGIAISMFLTGLACAFAGLCYAEFASMIPIAGSAYTYAYATLGEFVAWVIGWDLMLEYLFGATTVAVGWSGHVVALFAQFGVTLPARFTQSPFAADAANHLTRTGAVLNVPAMLIIAFVCVLLVIGVRESARFNSAVVVIKVSIVLLVIAFGAFYVRPEHWHPFVPPNQGQFGQFGWSGVVRGASVIFFAYIGFDAVSTAAQEAKNPQRDMPIGILGSLAICTLLYMLTAVVLTGLVDFHELNVPDPILVAIHNAGPALAWLHMLVAIGAVIGLASVVLVMLMAQPRIFYSMSKDGFLPPVFRKVHPRFRTPYVTTILTCSVAAVIAGIFPIGLLGQLTSVGTLLAFVIVCAGVLVLRRTRPDLPRPFRTPWVPVIPILGIISCFGLMLALPVDTWLRLAVWLVIGLVVYGMYGRHHVGTRAQ